MLPGATAGAATPAAVIDTIVVAMITSPRTRVSPHTAGVLRRTAALQVTALIPPGITGRASLKPVLS
jgi:hypothetical protein